MNFLEDDYAEICIYLYTKKSVKSLRLDKIEYRLDDDIWAADR